MKRIENIIDQIIPLRATLFDEYVESDGLIYCKNCKTARQEDCVVDGERYVFGIMCDCQRERFEREQKEAKFQAYHQYIEGLRAEGIAVPSYRKYTFASDDGKTPETTKICKKYVERFDELATKGQGLLLYGGVGTGKTYLAMCIANALIDKGRKVLHTSLAAVVQMAQDFNNAEKHYKGLMSKECIVIDDLGTERGTTFADEQIYKFIDGCNTYDIPMIITTNHSLKQIETASKDTTNLTYARIYSRILEKCYPVKVNDYKRRMMKAVENRIKIASLLDD
jgi:DNA replication protein DnaC